MDKKQPEKTDNGLAPVVPPEQLLNKKAEEYLRESGNIEDLPDAEEIEDAEKTEADENRKKSS